MCGALNAAGLEGIFLDKSFQFSEKRNYHSLRLSTHKNIEINAKNLVFSEVSWNQYYHPTFTGSIGAGFRHRGKHGTFGVNKFFDMSNFSTKFVIQSGVGIEFLKHLYEMRFNSYFPYARKVVTNDYKLEYHPYVEFGMAVRVAPNFKIIVMPAYSFFNHKIGSRAGFCWHISNKVSLNMLFGHDFFHKKNFCFALKFGTGHDYSYYAPTIRSYDILYKKLKLNPIVKEEPHLPVLDRPIMDKIRVELIHDRPIIDIKTGQNPPEKSNFFLWRWLGWE